MLGNDSDQALLQLEHVIDLALDVARLSLGPAGHLVDHDVGIREGETLALGSGAQQDRAHARRHAKAVGRYIAGKKLHRVVNCQPGGDGAARRVDVKVEVLLPVLHLQEEHLGNNQIRDVIVDRCANEDDPVLEQP